MKAIHAALAVILLGAAQPAVAGITHIRGMPVPPIQTVEQARAETDKRLAAIQAREAAEAKVAAQVTSSPSAITHSPLFFTGKPLVEETGQYAFLFRHYDPELNRWTTSDPSGFPDGANNLAYMAVPTSEFDLAGLKSIAWVYYTPSNFDGNPIAALNANIALVRKEMEDADKAAGSSTHYLDNGDTFGSLLVANTAQGINSFFESYERLVLFSHGSYFQEQYYWGGATSGHLTSVFGENAANITLVQNSDLKS